MRSLGLAVLTGIAGGLALREPAFAPLAWVAAMHGAWMVGHDRPRLERFAGSWLQHLCTLAIGSAYLPDTLRVEKLAVTPLGSLGLACAIWLAGSALTVAPVLLGSTALRRIPVRWWWPPAFLAGEALRRAVGRWSLDWLLTQWTSPHVLALVACVGWTLAGWTCLFACAVLADALPDRSPKLLLLAAAPTLLVLLLPALPVADPRLVEGIGAVYRQPTTRVDHLPAGVDLVVWPENWLAFRPRLEEGAGGTVERLDMGLPGAVSQLVGATTRVAGPEGWRPPATKGLLAPTPTQNAILAVAEDGRITGVRSKRELFPLVETKLGPLGPPLSTLVPGTGVPLLAVAGRRVVPLVCVEAFSRTLVEEGRAAQGDLVTISAVDDGLAGDATGARQMVAAMVLRAVESGLPVVRASTSGPAAFVLPDGRVLATSEPGTTGVLAPVPRPPRALP